jgi:CDP-4-dehydro-6-deoxyglucose reductase, E1
MALNIDIEINKLITSLGKEFKILEYVYNGHSFIEGVTPIYYSGPYWDNKEITAAIKSLLIGKWLSAGENVQLFENEFAKKINERHAVMVNSGSSANLIMLAALKKYYKWDNDSEIILSVVGFPTTLSSLLYNNLKPIFIDIEMDSLNFDLDKIQEKITKNTKAVFLSPVLGNPVDMDRMLKLCKDNNIELVLDNCDSLGTKWNSKYLNEYSLISSYSFYPSHHITTGEGGMVVSKNKELIKLARSFAWWGRDCCCTGACNLLPLGACGNRFDKWLEDYDGIIDHKYLFVNIGQNLKPLDLQGAIGLVQLEKFDEIHKKRYDNKTILGDLITNNIKDIYIPVATWGAHVSWFGVPIICKDKQLKDKLVAHFEKNKIQTRNYFAGNILLHPAYKHLDNFRNYPFANQVLDRVFFIGTSPHYNTSVFNYIEKVLKDFIP